MEKTHEPESVCLQHGRETSNEFRWFATRARVPKGAASALTKGWGAGDPSGITILGILSRELQYANLTNR